MFQLSLVLVALFCLFIISAAVSECSDIFTDEQFYLESSKYTKRIGNNTLCDFIIKGDKCPTYFKFEFLERSLEKTPNCQLERLVINKDEVLCDLNPSSKIYHSQNGILHIKYYSNRMRDEDGFRILITRLPCDIHPIRKLQKRSFFHPVCKSPNVPFLGHYQNHHNLIYSNSHQINTENFCCASRYTSKRFIISSPNFPHIKNNPSDCVYHIYRANEKICRLRLNFLFYWNGYLTAYGCQNGQLEIDGKCICGCRVGLKLTSSFGSEYGSNPKVIRYKNSGYPLNKFSGFAIEVIQDECSAISRHDTTSEDTYFGRFRRWINHNFQEDSNLVNGETDNNETYVETARYNPFFPSGADDYKCRIWGVAQWAILAKKILWKKMPKCTNVNVPECLELTDTEGCIKSPGYPLFYPNNLDVCYRFIKRPGYCYLRLTMTDFMLENSYECSKDYLLLGYTRKFCGTQLFSTYSKLIFLNGTYEDIRFVSDQHVSCRGFKAWYQQIPCDSASTTTTESATISITTMDSTVPTPTSAPITTTVATATTPTTTTTTIDSSTITSQCYKEYSERSFVMEHYGYEDVTCTFNVIKYDPDVCLLTLEFLIFDLPCDLEYLELYDGRRYCGSISSASIDFSTNNMTFTYYRINSVNAINLRFRINAVQQTNCEPDPELMPENLERAFKQYKTTVTENQENGLNIRIRNLNADMCGLIIQISNDYYINFDLCNLLTNPEEARVCILLEDQSFYVPYVDDRIDLTIKTRDVYNSMRFKEIRCGDMEELGLL